ncbi:MAG: TetR/AcrR family transcriptional regulator [Actinomycetota bacterium]
MRTLPVAIVDNEAVMAETFAGRGFDETRMEDLAEATGVPKATLYYHFGGKDEILAWLMRSMLSALGEAVAEAASGRGGARRRLEAVVRAQLRVMAERPASCRILIADLGRAARIPELAEALGRAFHAPVLRLLADGAADGSWRKVKDPTTVASSMFGAVVIPALDTLIAGEPLDPDQVAPPILRFIFTGLIGR